MKRRKNNHSKSDQSQQMQIKKLKKVELLEILVEQSQRIDELEEALEKTKMQLRSRRIKIQKAGTLAEASLQLNQIFEDADAAAKQYLDNIRRVNELAERKRKRLEKELKKESADVNEKKTMESGAVTHNRVSGDIAKTRKI